MKRILPVLIGIILFVALTGSARAVVIYEAGYRLCDFLCNPYTAYGTTATITIPSQTALPGDSVSFWTSLDEWPTGIGIPAGTHWWAQAGYIIGLAPNGLTYSLPEMYIETNGNSYSFQPVASVGWSTLHTFQVWVSPTNGAANFVIDGSQIAVVGMPLQFNEGGTVSDFLEVHQSSSGSDTSTGTWSNLQYYQCWIVGQSCWNSWDCFDCVSLAISTPPYYVTVSSRTAFTTYTCTSMCGGGGGSVVKRS